MFGLAIDSDAREKVLAELVPPLQAFNFVEPSGARLVIYAAIAVLLVAASSLLYAKRPLERAGSAVAFGFMETAFCVFLALMLMTMGALSLERFSLFEGGSDALRIFLMASGYFIGFIIARLIAKRRFMFGTKRHGFSFA
jgi:hypothetical protein